ncbi:Cytochrome b-c1 complex subunit 6 [Golovinomyces cichoracearum]|uniref:Cytochrome b-c1 complex subunit 6, mitochondrial n=1 Tax=Golovinomyces cichoracearum TaxID=62708 RepID=A0A420IPR2_9PEZI|nr:Cytochrome b-c1 complex subunit 6 [Golovinomyces cichoracearum]
MIFSASWSDLIEAVSPWTNLQAEAPVMEEEKNNEEIIVDSDTVDKSGPEAEEEEEEEEPELVDPKETIEEECKNSKTCSPAKHHFEECVERVTSGKGTKDEDCVEEFFHLTHCASTCAAPKLWKVLK